MQRQPKPSLKALPEEELVVLLPLPFPATAWSAHGSLRAAPLDSTLEAAAGSPGWGLAPSALGRASALGARAACLPRSHRPPQMLTR